MLSVLINEYRQADEEGVVKGEQVIAVGELGLLRPRMLGRLLQHRPMPRRIGRPKRTVMEPVQDSTAIKTASCGFWGLVLHRDALHSHHLC